MAQDPLSGFKAAVSEERFAGYCKTAVSEVEAVGRYVWNARLCESLYPALLNFEVALRNSLHVSLVRRYPNGPWLDVPCWMDLKHPILGPDEVKEVLKAKRRLLSREKPLAVGSIVAELNFGFWNSLLDLRYERANTLWPHLLASVFPLIPRARRTRKVVSARVNRIRLLRNRVFHHEPIWHWRDLRQQHDDLIDALGWINADLVQLTLAVDRFDDVFHEGWQRYRCGVIG